MPEPIDTLARKTAVTEQDRNIVVTAGAGTGKTTLLVNRMLHLLLGHKRFQKEESPILRIVAMTFTDKAASEMKLRLAGELEKIVAVIKGTSSQEEKETVEEFLAYIRDTYHTTYSEIERRARKSLEDMDKALIGTIHSFAAYILRLYPIESSVVPGFTVDEGDVFDELFDKEWARWIEPELSLTSPNANIWKIVLRHLSLESLKEFAKRLSGFTIPLDSLTLPDNNKSNAQSLTDPLLSKILKIIPHCEKPNNNLLSQLNELSKVLDAVNKQGIGYLNNLEYDFDKNPSEAKTGWIADSFETAQELAKDSHALLKKLKSVNETLVKNTLDLIIPFAKGFKQIYLSQGYVSFDGLLTLTRNLLQNKEYRYVRNKLKSEFRAILVDEFQDTDPVQYEIVLFLSESLEHYSKDARKVTLEPGKLFIVGDPKQSIYAFRRADIEAYEHVVKLVSGGQEETLKLQENFRSHSGIIDVVNQLFNRRIMVEQPGLQPSYIPIHANRPKKYPSQNVEIVLVFGKEGEELKADEAREAEAEWIARWITKHVNNEIIEDKLSETGIRKLKYKDTALLLRAFTQVRPYVEAFKRYGIPYIVEGEKYFYTTQEILDFISLLRIIENPHDTIALVGVLRSPIVGLTDREIYELKINQLLDYRKSISDKISFKNIVENFYNFLRNTHARAGIIPVSQLISEIIDNSHVAEITASAWHGEQKLANILKLYQMASDMEQLHGISLKTFLERIKMRIKEAREEGESPLSDETLDVVKILTIHKAKGLEFPVVILGNMHGEVKKDNEVLDSAVYDWSTSTTGIVIGSGNHQVRNLQSIVIENKLNNRAWEEEKRVLYVAMTRAKERLILTGLLKDDNKSYMGLITQSVRDIAGVQPGDETFISLLSTGEEENLSPSPNPSHQGRGNSGDSTSRERNKTTAEKLPLHLRERVGVRGISRGKFPLGSAEVFVEHFRFDGTHHPKKSPKEKKIDTDWASLVEIWKKRKAIMEEAANTPIFISPSTISKGDAIPQKFPSAISEAEETADAHLNYAATIGSICHRVLEELNFHGTKEELHRSIESAAKWIVAVERTRDVTIAKYRAEDFIYKAKDHTVPPSLQGNEKEPVVKLKKTPQDTPQSQDVKHIEAEALKILSNFIDSEAYKEIQGAQILGREVPILLRWNGQIMRGAIDILYKIGNQLIIADYKTDYIKITDIQASAEKYRYQKEIYTEAAKRCLNIGNPEFKLIFIRLGKAISI